MQDIVDLTIIGGGPTGLFGAFYAGMRGMSCRIVDSLPELGGQLTALYPEKFIFDVGGFPKVRAKNLARELVDQGLQFGAEVVLDEEVRGLREEDGVFVLEGASAEYRTRTVLIAGGKGAFEPMVLKCPGYEELLGRGVEYSVRDPEVYRGKRVVLVKPRTFMNVSGEAVRYAMDRYRVRAESVLIVLDDLDLPLGRIRMRASGGSGGHNGLNSINAALGTQDYARLRIGIGRPQGETVGYVLGAFTPEEAPEAEAALERAVDAVEAWLTHGVNHAMDNFN